MNKQAILDVLNSLEVVEQQGGDGAYILVDVTPEMVERLTALGVSQDTIHKYGDAETVCILALAFGEGYADDCENGKLVVWGPLVSLEAMPITVDADGIIDDVIATLAKAQQAIAQQRVALPKSEWHEDIGPVLWWEFHIEEPPYVGTPLDSDWPGYHTHWTTIQVPKLAEQPSIKEGEKTE